MKQVHIVSAILLATAALGAQAQDVGQSRAQVQAELSAAQRSGNVMAAGETGLTLRELFPERYAALPAVAGKTRSQVLAELTEAQRKGELPLGGEAGIALNQAYPGRYPGTVQATLGRTRAEVQAELAEARRNGDVLVGDSNMTLREEFPQQYPKGSRGRRADARRALIQGAISSESSSAARDNCSHSATMAGSLKSNAIARRITSSVGSMPASEPASPSRLTTGGGAGRSGAL